MQQKIAIKYYWESASTQIFIDVTSPLMMETKLASETFGS